MEALGNIHPAIVHFPIALLILYATLELIPVKLWREKLFITKSILIFSGTLSVYVSRITGEEARKAYGEGEILKLIETHEFYSLITFGVFLVLCALYAVSCFNRFKNHESDKEQSGFSLTKIYENYFLLVPLALIGLLAVSITGALGGAIVWGPTNDPFVQFVYNMLIK